MALLAAAGCGDDAGGTDDGSGAALAERVVAVLATEPESVIERLAELSVDVDADELDELELTCPAVRDPAPGNRATCTTAVGRSQLAIDVEFGEGDALTVVLIEVQIEETP